MSPRHAGIEPGPRSIPFEANEWTLAWLFMLNATVFLFVSGEGEELWVRSTQWSLRDFQAAEPYSFPVNFKTVSEY